MQPNQPQQQPMMQQQVQQPVQQPTQQGQAAPQQQNSQIEQQVEQVLGSLSDENKAFAAAIMTPEMAGFMSEFMGQEVGNVFNKYSNPDMVLVSLPRTDVEALLAELEGSAEAPTMEGDMSAGMDMQEPIAPESQL